MVTGAARSECRTCGGAHSWKTCPKTICHICKTGGHISSLCPRAVCHACRASGHIAAACPQQRQIAPNPPPTQAASVGGGAGSSTAKAADTSGGFQLGTYCTFCERRGHADAYCWKKRGISCDICKQPHPTARCFEFTQRMAGGGRGGHLTKLSSLQIGFPNISHKCIHCS